ncbi:MAG: hypothetical protein SFU87_20665 [Chitinophagaceae bacterium]|nr:hypothetical protein [Chitinophagaceae bacterium]
MNFSPENLYHIYNQGNNRQAIFLSDNDYIIFIGEIRRCILPHAEIVAWCLMPNHFHILLFTDERCNKSLKQGGLIIDPVTNGIRKLLSGYARIFNKQYSRTGSLFRQKTKSKCLTDGPWLVDNPLTVQDYCFNCFHYIHQNPLKAGIVKKLEEWEFSSYRDYARLRNGTLCNKELAKIHCDYTPETFVSTSHQLISDDVINLMLK